MSDDYEGNFIEYWTMRSREAFNVLEKLGALRARKGFLGDTITFDPPPKIRKADIPTFARAIRFITLQERYGIVVAHINRMGKVEGFHIPPR